MCVGCASGVCLCSVDTKTRPPAAVQASAQGIDFQAADVFFTLCMLQLPQQSMATFFVRSVQSYAELMASLDRMAPLLAVEDRTQVPERSDPPQERAATFDAFTRKCHKDMSSEDTQQQEVRIDISLLCAWLSSSSAIGLTAADISFLG